MTIEENIKNKEGLCCIKLDVKFKKCVENGIKKTTIRNKKLEPSGKSFKFGYSDGSKSDKNYVFYKVEKITFGKLSIENTINDIGLTSTNKLRDILWDYYPDLKNNDELYIHYFKEV